MAILMERYDLVTIGGGPGATPGAQLVAKAGLRVAVVEAGAGLGGACLFEGCIPSKIYLESAGRIAAMYEAEAFGIEGTAPGRPHTAQINRRKMEMLRVRVEGARRRSESLGIELVQGTARLLSPREVQVTLPTGDQRLLTADHVFVAPGAAPVPLAVPGADNQDIWTSREALMLPRIPPSLAIIGGGYIGCELATIYSRFGSQVHILETMPRILSSEDPAMSEAVTQGFKRAPFTVAVETGVQVLSIDRAHPQAYEVVYETATGDRAVLHAAQVLIAVGRRPNTAGLGLEEIGLRIGQRGEIPVDPFFQTAVPGVYAPGDVNGQAMLAHAATRQSLIAARHLVHGPFAYEPLVVPHVVFTEPEVAAVGADSRDLQRHPEWRQVRLSFAQDAKARILGDIEGLAQLIWDPGTGLLHGLQVAGRGASELVAEATQLLAHHGTVQALADTIHVHPTLNEVVMELAQAALA